MTLSAHMKRAVLNGCIWSRNCCTKKPSVLCSAVGIIKWIFVTGGVALTRFHGG
jgi:hypothetical protein